MKLPRHLVFLACLALLACGGRAFPVLKPGDVNAVRLTEASQPSPAIPKVIAALEANGENPADFFLGPVRTDSEGLLELPLYYRTAFEEPLAPGNPGGKGRTFYFDPKLNSVVKQLWWQ